MSCAVVSYVQRTDVEDTPWLVLLFQTFKEQIEKPDQYNGALLGLQDTKIIFGNIPPIYEVHKKMRDDLQHLLDHWTEDASVGDVILKHVNSRCFV